MALSVTRRTVLKTLGVAAASAGAAPALAAPSRPDDVGVLVDLTRCDGCPDVPTPRCVSACRAKNQARYPEPDPGEPIQDYWPQPKHEDWRPKRESTATLTPYNWTYVQKVSVEHGGQTHELHIQRRCMHCDLATCAATCPFSVIETKPGGAVHIAPHLCVGGAKCRSVCPWNIPQRQAGVGLYMEVMPKLAGGGVMFKCDLCFDRLAEGRAPDCVFACRERLGENAPLLSGPRAEIVALARHRARQLGGYTYGDVENGGTGTVYVSPVPFAAIEAALRTREKERFFFPANPNPLAEAHGALKAALWAPLVGVAGALVAGARAVGKRRNANQTEGGA